MAYRNQDLFGDGTNTTQGATAFLRALGGWGNIAGPSLFMIKATVFGSASAVLFGMTGAMAGAMVYGTASLPFIVMSSVGFAVGMTRWYIASVSQALMQLERFPALLRLHMDFNFPSQRFRLKPLDYFQHDEFKRSWRMQSMLVVAWLTAQGAIDVSFLFSCFSRGNIHACRIYTRLRSRLLFWNLHRIVLQRRPIFSHPISSFDS